MQDAETGQRGYLLTENQSYLEPYDSGLVSIRRQMDALGEKLIFQSDQTESLITLKTHMDRKLAELAETIVLRRAGHFSEAIAIVSTDRGRQAMDIIRSDIAAMRNVENDVSRVQTAEDFQGGGYFRTVTTVTTAGILVFAVLVLDFSKKRVDDILEARDALRRSLDTVIEEISKRKQVEERLRHSQKLEWIGQLSGGMAHDFDHKVTVIIGGMNNLIKRRLERGETDVRLFMDEVVKSAERAAVLVNRLLAFSRQQPLDPQPIDGDLDSSRAYPGYSARIAWRARASGNRSGRWLWLAFADQNQSRPPSSIWLSTPATPCRTAGS